MSDAHGSFRDFPRWLPNCREHWHFSSLPGSLTQAQIPYRHPGALESGYFSVVDTARLMQGFALERRFTKDRRVIDMCIEPMLMVCRTPDQCCRQITDFIEYIGGLLVMAQAGFSATPTQSTASP